MIARARVFVPSPPATATVDLSRLPDEMTTPDPARVLSCRYVPKPTTGTTSKFDCRLDTGRDRQGEVRTQPGTQGEIAATRLFGRAGYSARIA
jgi:hypothetical protein